MPQRGEQRTRLVAQLESLGARRLQLTEPGAAQPALQLRSLSVGPTTIDLHRQIVRHPDFIANRFHTRWLEQVMLAEPAIAAE